MKKLILKKCLHCGAIVKIITDCECDNCGIMCCNEPMQEIHTNSTDAAIEKHKPTYEVLNDQIHISVNHVMEKDHYIEWICLLTDKTEEYTYFKPGDIPEANYPKVTNGKIYAYCNKHGLWVNSI